MYYIFDVSKQILSQNVMIVPEIGVGVIPSYCIISVECHEICICYKAHARLINEFLKEVSLSIF